MQDKLSDQIFESLVRESLGGPKPPDLSKRILDAWQAEKLTGGAKPASMPPVEPKVSQTPRKPLVVAELVVRRPPVDNHGRQSDSEAGDSRLTATPILPPTANAFPSSGSFKSSIATAADTSRTSSSRRQLSSNAWRGLLSLSAIGLLTVIGWTAYQNILPELTTVEKSSPGVDSVDGKAPLRMPAPSIAAADKKPATNPTPSTPEQLDLADVPFAPGQPSTTIAQLAPNTQLKPDIVVKTDLEVVESVNRSLSGLWSSLGVAPSAAIDVSEVQARLSSQLSIQASSVSLDGDVIRQTRQKPFADRLASNFTESWLARASLDSDSKQAFTQYLSGQIRSGKGFNQVAEELIGGDLEIDSIASKFISGLAGNGNHLLVQRIGQHFLDANLACVQCHDSPTNARPGIATSQDTYWSLVAAMKGIDIADAGSERRASDNQAELFASDREPNAFYDLLDGRMRAATARLPDGSSWKRLDAVSPRKALAAWIADSANFDMAIVNQVWQAVVGQPLVPQINVVDLAGIPDRLALQKELASQFRASGHDIGRLASWIINSNAFNRSSPTLNAGELRIASDETLHQIALAQSVFAAAAYPRQRQPLEANIAIALQMRGNSVDSTLAQPDTSNLKKSRTTGAGGTQSQEASQFSASFSLGAERPKATSQQYVETLLKADRLSWSDRVQHVVLLNPTAVSNGRVQHLAQSLLQKHNGDARQALLDLLWAVENSL